MASSVKELQHRRETGNLCSMTGCAQVVTFIGAGGKTTCLQTLTQEIVAAGEQVVATTTTKVFPEETMRSWRNSNPPPLDYEGACFWYADVMKENGKWMGLPVQAIDVAITRASGGSFPTCTNASRESPRTVPDLHWLIEGDGARGLKLKCWEPHEPQIPWRTECVVLVVDGGLWGNILQEEQVHRPGCCLDLLGHIWNAEKAWSYFLRSPIFAPQYGEMSWVVLLNRHGEDSENVDAAEQLDPLQALIHRWTEIQCEAVDLKNRPSHLRLAAGDAKEGKLQWLDLW